MATHYNPFFVALSSAGMHYTGMYSMRMLARVEWSYVLVALSVLIAILATFYHTGGTLPAAFTLLPSDELALAVTVGTLLILSLALIGAAVDRAFRSQNRMAAGENQRGQQNQHFEASRADEPGHRTTLRPIEAGLGEAEGPTGQQSPTVEHARRFPLSRRFLGWVLLMDLRSYR